METLNLTPKQLHILTRVNDIRLAYGYSPTMQELADELGVSKVTVFEHVEALIRKGALIRDPNKARSLTVSDEVELPDNRTTKIPLVGSIAAGKPIDAVEEREYLDLEGMFFPTRRRKPVKTFALRVKGDSMIEEQIRNGDYVICEQTDTARNGQTVVALIDNEEATLKKFYKERGKIRLQPANKKYDPIYVKDCQIQGVVIGVVRSC